MDFQRWFLLLGGFGFALLNWAAMVEGVIASNSTWFGWLGVICGVGISTGIILERVFNR